MSDLRAIGTMLAARRPGHSLPQGLYNDPVVHDFDLKAIFARNWLLVAVEAELPKPGSYKSLEVGPWPVLLVRDRSGTLRAFHNSCRHRGAPVCEGQGVTARLVCPYHRWTYELSGELAHAGRMPDDFVPAEHSLKPVALESLCGVIYICLADVPPDFAPFRQAFEPLLAPHDLANSKVAHTSTLVEKANWKLVMENARECYHCPGAHPELSVTFPIGASAHFDYGEDRHAEAFYARMQALGLPSEEVDGGWWQAVRFPLNEGCVSMTMDGQRSVDKLMCPIGDGDIGSLRWALEPNCFCHATGDFVFIFTCMPTGPHETVVTAKWLVRGDAVEGVDYDLDRLTALWDRTNLQDRTLAENNQRGVNSLGYTPGPYSPDAEALLVRFVDWYCAQAKAFLDEVEPA
ncbi:aromatic ring-hydroxylating dioxygenase subunit alpha [soil metagenome]